MQNILLDADAMYPDGFHPVAMERAGDFSDPARYISRTSAGAKAKYYYVDFGISVYIPEDVDQKLVTGVFGRDQDPPELSDLVPYDPFKLDIFIIGNMFRREFYQVGVLRHNLLAFRLRVLQTFTNVEFLKDLIEVMTHPQPISRPSAMEALALWKKMRETVWTLNREWRPRPRREHPGGSEVFDALSLHRVFMFFARSLTKHLPL